MDLSTECFQPSSEYTYILRHCGLSWCSVLCDMGLVITRGGLHRPHEIQQLVNEAECAIESCWHNMITQIGYRITQLHRRVIISKRRQPLLSKHVRALCKQALVNLERKIIRERGRRGAGDPGAWILRCLIATCAMECWVPSKLQASCGSSVTEKESRMGQ